MNGKNVPNKKLSRGDLKLVAVAPNSAIAASWREILAQAGIPSFTPTRDPLAAAYLVDSPYPCEIFTLPEHESRAKEILDDLLEISGEENP